MFKIFTYIPDLIAISFILLFWQREPPPSDVVMLGAIFLWLLTVVIRKSSLKFDLVDWSVLGFGLLNLFQLAGNRESQSVFWVLVTSFLILSYLLIRNISKIEKYFRAIWKSYLIASIISAVIMFSGFIAFYSYQINTLFFMEYGRAKGLFKDPNVAGPFLIPAFLYLSWRFLRDPSFPKLLIINLLYISIFFALSRGGIINLAVAASVVIVLLWRDFFEAKRLSALIFLSIFLSSLFIFFYPPFYNLASDRFVFLKNYDTQGRISAWQSAENVQIIGSGPGTYEISSSMSQLNEAEKRINESITINEVDKEGLIKKLKVASTSAETAALVGVTVTPSAHNTYLRILKENGLIGLVLFMTFISLTIVKFIRMNRLINNPLSKIIFASMIGLLINAITIDALHWRLLWYLPALLLASLELKRAKN